MFSVHWFNGFIKAKAFRSHMSRESNHLLVLTLRQMHMKVVQSSS